MSVTSYRPDEVQRQCRKKIECKNTCKTYRLIGFILMGIVISSIFTNLSSIFRNIAMAGSVFAFFAAIMTKLHYNTNNKVIVRLNVNKDIAILALASGIYMIIILLL